MSTRIVTIKATDVALDLINKRDTGVPYGWVSNVFAKMLARVPADEQVGVLAHGLEAASLSYPHKLTEAEVLAEQVQTLVQRAKAIDQMLPRVGEGLTPEEVSRIRKILEGI